jgi:uncharacterized protein
MSEPVDLRPPKRCPICGKPAVLEYRPFCSRRCADIDLNRWLVGAYAFDGGESEDGNGPEKPDGEKRDDD